MTSAKKFWDKQAEGYARSPISDMDAYNYTLERTKSYLGQSDRVLEVGAGTGSTALLLAPGVAEYVSSDISTQMTRIGQRKADADLASPKGLRFVACAADDPTLGEAPFDAVLALNFLHLIEDLPAMLALLHSRVKPGGYLITKSACLRSPGWGFKFGLLKLLLPPMQLIGLAPYVNRFTSQELEGRIEAAGFEIIETGNYPAKPPNRYVVARRT